MATLTFDLFARDRASGVIGRVGGNVGRLHVGLGKLATAFAGLAVINKTVGFFKDANAEARESQKVNAQTAAVLRSTGHAAGITATQIGNLATKISNKAGIDDEAIQSGENLLLTFKDIRNESGKGNDVFNQTTQVMTDMSVAMGQSMKTSAIQLGKALNDPAKGMTALTKVGVTFTDQQQKQVKALVASGNTMAAQKIILKELNSEFGGSAAKQATWADKAKVAWGNFQEAVGTAVIPLIDKLSQMFVTELVPAVARFSNWVQSTGAPALQRFATVVAAKVMPIARAFGKWIVGSAVPALVKLGKSIGGGLVRAFHMIGGAIQENRPQLELLGKALVKVGAFIGRNVLPVAGFLAKVLGGVVVVAIVGAIKIIGRLVNAFVWIGKAILSFANISLRAFRWVLSGFLGFVGTVIHDSAKLFGWLPLGVGKSLKSADASFSRFKDGTNAKLQSMIDKTASMRSSLDALSRRRASPKVSLDISRALAALRALEYARQVEWARMNATLSGTGASPARHGGAVLRASGGRVTKNLPYIVGERRPEWFVPDSNGRIVPRVTAGSSVASDGGEVANLHVTLQLDGRAIQTSLLKVKRRNGGLALGLA